MRTLPLVLALLVVNDAALLFVLDVRLSASVFVAVGAVVLSGTVLAVVAATVNEDEPPTRRELQAEIEGLRAELQADRE